MAKFLSIPVTGEQDQIVSADNVKLVEQTSSTAVTISYGDGLRAVITHAGIAAGSESMRDLIQDCVVRAQRSNWHEAVENVAVTSAVSGITLLTIT